MPKFIPIKKNEFLMLMKKLKYDKDTGIFTWILNCKYNPKSGIKRKIAGTIVYTGYVRIQYKWKAYLAHRLAWCFVYGIKNQPEFLDHKDNIKHHNWIKNIRISTSSQNNYNRGFNKNNKLKIKGVSYVKIKDKYLSQVESNGIRYSKLFETEKEAEKECIKIRNIIHGEFCNHGKK